MTSPSRAIQIAALALALVLPCAAVACRASSTNVADPAAAPATATVPLVRVTVTERSDRDAHAPRDAGASERAEIHPADAVLGTQLAAASAMFQAALRAKDLAGAKREIERVIDCVGRTASPPAVPDPNPCGGPKSWVSLRDGLPNAVRFTKFEGDHARVVEALQRALDAKTLADARRKAREGERLLNRLHALIEAMEFGMLDIADSGELTRAAGLPEPQRDGGP